jgi:hypothetical protein
VAKKKQKLPLGAGCLATLFLIGSLFGIAAGSLYLLHRTGAAFPAIPKGIWAQMEMRGRATLYLGIVQAAVGLPMAIGLFARKFWAYCLFTIFNGFAIGQASVQVFMWHRWFAIGGLIINGLILIYMFLPCVRKVFN